jgi:hypothetical protein
MNIKSWNFVYFELEHWVIVGDHTIINLLYILSLSESVYLDGILFCVLRD